MPLFFLVFLALGDSLRWVPAPRPVPPGCESYRIATRADTTWYETRCIKTKLPDSTVVIP